LILRQHGGVPTNFELRAGVLQGFFGVFQDVVSILAVAVIDSEVGSRKLRLGGATGVDYERFPVFHGYSELHERHLFSAL